MYDAYRFSDFAFRKDDYIVKIAEKIKTGTYYPKPLLTIDVPKSSLSVRPGSVLDIEDAIVMFAIAYLIAPLLDKQLPDTVYSWRLKKGGKKNIFDDNEILKFPFLKRATIQKHIAFVEPWYESWPQFNEKVIAYEEDGYNFMAISDIVAYFENIDLALLRDLLFRYLPREQEIINFLIYLLNYWSWPAVHGGPSARGIPQGNGVSSFLGNIYLLPLDMAFKKLCTRGDIKYLRYMDDVKVLSKDIHVARDSLFLMNEKLRELHLNIQGAKTRILQGHDIRKEFLDDRLEKVNKIINNIQTTKNLQQNDRKIMVKGLKEELKKIKKRKSVIQDKELRLFRRITTGFTLLEHSGMVEEVLNQMECNPDARLLSSAAKYLRYRDQNRLKIQNRISTILFGDKFLFPYQEAYYLMILRYQRNIETDIIQKLKTTLKDKKKHWYVRQQAAQLISLKLLSQKELKTLIKLFNEESNVEIKRAIGQALTQLPLDQFNKLKDSCLYDTYPKIQRLGLYFHSMLYDGQIAGKQFDLLFNNFREENLVDYLYAVELLSKTKEEVIRKKLLKKLKKISEKLHRPILEKRVTSIIARLQKESRHP